jgi:hypothetical protein
MRRALIGIIQGGAPGLISLINTPVSAPVQQHQGNVLVMVLSEHERHVAVVVAGVDVGALADQLLDLVVVFEAGLVVVALKLGWALCDSPRLIWCGDNP